MNRTFIVLLLLLAVSGCKSKRELTAKSTAKIDEFINVESKTTESVKRDSAGIRFEESESFDDCSQSSETETLITEYDTSKPVDQATGRPPVVRETMTKTKIGANATKGSVTKKTEKSITLEEIEKDEQDSIVRRTASANTSEIHEVKKKHTGAWTLLIILVLGGGVIVVRKLLLL